MFHNHSAVSYTHLDVYKRQGTHSIISLPNNLTVCRCCEIISYKYVYLIDNLILVDYLNPVFQPDSLRFNKTLFFVLFSCVSRVNFKTAYNRHASEIAASKTLMNRVCNFSLCSLDMSLRRANRLILKSALFHTFSTLIYSKTDTSKKSERMYKIYL